MVWLSFFVDVKSRPQFEQKFGNDRPLIPGVLMALINLWHRGQRKAETEENAANRESAEANYRYGEENRGVITLVKQTAS